MYATVVLSVLPFQAADETDKTKTTFKVDTAELEKITLVVEREFRGERIHTTTADDYTFRANIYPHFTTSEEKAAIDASDSINVLIRGPWTRNAYAAIAELNDFVVPTFRKKLETLDIDDSVKSELAANKSYGELKLSVGELVVQWAGVNIRAVSKEENSKKSASASFSGGELPSATLIPIVHSTPSSNNLF